MISHVAELQLGSRLAAETLQELCQHADVAILVEVACLQSLDTHGDSLEWKEGTLQACLPPVGSVCPALLLFLGSEEADLVEGGQAAFPWTRQPELGLSRLEDDEIEEVLPVVTECMLTQEAREGRKGIGDEEHLDVVSSQLAKPLGHLGPLEDVAPHVLPEGRKEVALLVDCKVEVQRGEQVVRNGCVLCCLWCCWCRALLFMGCIEAVHQQAEEGRGWHVEVGVHGNVELRGHACVGVREERTRIRLVDLLLRQLLARAVVGADHPLVFQYLEQVACRSVHDHSLEAELLWELQLHRVCGILLVLHQVARHA
mmetsp:Transcript_13387/g.53278  ORF Transcript_13387/g.53278 Transcript_13387/m.53278 type:complete len:314 (-) Transcript_13387:125-1066(-)